MPIESAQDVNLMYVTLEAQREYGLKLPEFVTEYFPEKMQHIAERSVTYNTYTREMLKIKSGPFVKKMFAEMIEKRKRKLQRKLYIYAAHDWTMGSLMAAVKVWKPQPLHFAVTIIFELHQNQQTGDYYVQLYLRNRSCVELLDIPGCVLNAH
ncbi:unnamed protein product [Ceratitis capitata]|uniref:(Mediterranean fruit fly) hypothetical protein n=1 Tax=Ceratitis capitata TaxID=7213 RepID=A0A811UYW5_CERCA|nr:unnamed protein product [Ceratitis capitata]